MNFLENMYLTGHWTYYGSGVVSAALSGMELSKNIIATKYNYSRGLK
jgi:phytoene dehydrogenase-like protein